MKHFDKDIRWFRNAVNAVCISIMLALPAGATEADTDAGKLEGSTVYTGIKELIGDLTGALTVLCPLIGGVAALVFVIRRSMADEQDGKMWTKRINTAIICGVAGMLVSGLINLLCSYF